MLIASLAGQRLDAAEATKGQDYRCPQCDSALILKKGRIIVAHFAHKPPTVCEWGVGETLAHLLGKRLLYDAFTKQGMPAAIEYPVATLPGDRRADVMAWPLVTGGRGGVAFELQHSTISLDEIERRAFSYASAGIAQIWIPFLSAKHWADAERVGIDRFRLRYAPRLFERWIHGLNRSRGMWMFDPPRRSFWHGHLSGYQLWVEERQWFDEYGQEHYGGGYHRWSYRWRNLSLTGPFNADQLEIDIELRRDFQAEQYRWPAGLVAHLRLKREYAYTPPRGVADLFPARTAPTDL